MRGWSCCRRSIAYTKELAARPRRSPGRFSNSRGNTPRLFRNTLVFLAADKVRLQDLDEALRRYLAWKSIVAEKETLNLDPHQVQPGRDPEAGRRRCGDGAIARDLPMASGAGASEPPGTDQLARRFGYRLEMLLRFAQARDFEVTNIWSLHYGSTILRKHLDEVPLWRGEHVAVKQLVEDFARYLYLPRLAGSDVLAQAVRDGVALLTWRSDSFAYAESYDEAAGRYRGLRAGQTVNASTDSTALLVKSDIARRQLDVELRPEVQPAIPAVKPGEAGVAPAPPKLASTPRRFHGSVTLDTARVGRDAGKIAEEVIAHLAGLVGAEVTVTLEIQAEMPSGASDNIIRTVTENCRTLKFSDHGFEQE